MSPIMGLLPGRPPESLRPRLRRDRHDPAGRTSQIHRNPRTTPYTAFQAVLDPLAPWGVRSYWRGEYMGELRDAAIDTFLARGVDLTVVGAPLSQTIIFRIGQGVAAVPDMATA